PAPPPPLSLHDALPIFKAHPLGAPYVAGFEPLRTDGVHVLTQELSCLEAQVSAQAQVDAADDGLDDFAGRVSKAILTITRDDREDRKSTRLNSSHQIIS